MTFSPNRATARRPMAAARVNPLLAAPSPLMSSIRQSATLVGNAAVVWTASGMRKCLFPKSSPRGSVLQLPLQNLPGQRGVRFAFAQLYHLAFEEVKHIRFVSTKPIFESESYSSAGGGGLPCAEASQRLKSLEA